MYTSLSSSSPMKDFLQTAGDETGVEKGCDLSAKTPRKEAGAAYTAPVWASYPAPTTPSDMSQTCPTLSYDTTPRYRTEDSHCFLQPPGACHSEGDKASAQFMSGVGHWGQKEVCLLESESPSPRSPS